MSYLRGAADLPQTQRLHSIDVFQLEYTDDVQISPDGSSIVYVRVSHDIMTDRARRNLWIVNADGTNNRPLRSEAKNFMSPRWSPDGKRLAYVSAAEGSPQLYVRWIDTGQTALLTNLVQAPGAIAWSVDGKSIAFTQLVPAKKPPLATPPEKPEGAQWAPPVKVIDSVVYRADGEGYLESGYQHVFVVSAEGGTPRQLTEGEFNDDGPLSFTPDNKRLVFSANRGADWERDPQESEVFTVDIATAEAHPAHHARRPGQLARGVAGWAENRLPGLRRSPAGLPGHSSICDGQRWKELARTHGRP